MILNSELTKMLSRSLENIERVEELLKKKRKIILSGIPQETRAFYLSGLFYLKRTIFDRHGSPVLLFVSNENRAGEFFSQLSFWNSIFSAQTNKPLISIEDLSTFWYDLDSKNEKNRKKVIQKQKILDDLTKNKTKIHIAPINIITEPCLPKKDFLSNTIHLEVEQKICPMHLTKKLIKAGYLFEKTIAEEGTFSKQGGIINIFPINFKDPLRLEFKEERIQTIQSFDLRTKKKKEDLISINIVNALSLENVRGNLLDYFSALKNPLLVLENPEEFQDSFNFSDSGFLAKFNQKIQDFQQIIFETLPQNTKNEIKLNYQSPIFYFRNIKTLLADLTKKQKANWHIFILTQYRESLKKLFLEKKISSTHFINLKNKTQIQISGFSNKTLKTCLITDNEIFGQAPKKKEKINQAFISKLTPGDFIVHIDYGIGKFLGMEKREIDGGVREFLILEYAEGDKLFLPAEYVDKICKYVGQAHPKIHRLHQTSWHQVKEKVRKDAQRIAKNLLELQAQREISQGFIFSKDTLAQKELEDSFEYQETKDQLKVLQEIKQDMEGQTVNQSIDSILNLETNKRKTNKQFFSKKPMDRLICGDVGFGKTEIAIRCAHKAVCDKKQVAVLCPTTILAQQHYDTFISRINPPVKIEVLSRFRTKKQQKKIIQKLKEGKIDIIIGTHRLLSKDVKFKDLGLVIIDEEQRFGVNQKEKLKEIRKEVDVLALSATPIPRTLYYALSGLKSISILETPPAGRKPIETQILPINDKIIARAIHFELARSGQVYFLHNRIETICAWAKKLKKLVPCAKIGIVHGRLPEHEIAQTMHDFDTQKINVLVCSSIIENGLDLPNANTLIVEDATKFGLADLYQLRGRIGRGLKQAYAYFFYHSKKLTGQAKKRLEALLLARELGSGFQIAHSDLEIRGAGNLLGKEQSGNINALGLNLYCRLLAHTISEIKSGKKENLALNVTIDLPFSAHIPKSFIPNQQERLRIYQNAANLYEIKDLLDFKKEIIKQKKKIPSEFENLFLVLELKILAQKAGIKNIDTKIIRKLGRKKTYRFVFEFENAIEPLKIKKLLKKNPFWSLDENLLKIDQENLKSDWLSELKESLMLLAK